MTISFNSIPSSLRVPFVAVEFDASRAKQGPALLAYRALLIGQMHSGGSASANTLHKVTNADQVVALAGRGSQLHRMALAWFAANKSTEVWVAVLADDGAAVAATATLTVTGTATADGTISLYVGGALCRVAVAKNDTATQIGDKIVAALGATAGLKDFPVHASNSTGTVTVTANNKGASGNEIDLRLNYRDGESLPAGVAIAVVAMASGATNPVLTSLITALGDSWFQIWAHPYTDATSLTAIENELSSRFGPMRMIDGVAITAKSDTYSNCNTLGAGRNSPHSCIVRTNASPTWSAEYAAHVAGVVALAAQIDPARPLQTLSLSAWVLAPVESDRDTLSARNTALFSGVSQTRVAAGDEVQIERLITTYNKNSANSPDDAYLAAETMFTLLYARYSFRARILSRYPRAKLASDTARIAPGQAVITPSIGKAEALAWFRDLEELGLFENFDQFKADLVVERNQSDPTRLDFLLPPDLINQFVVGAAKLQFLL